jgi:hypothetical protein
MIGLYAVVNTHNHRAYIGSSQNVNRRLSLHRWAIKHGRFLNRQPYADDARKFGFGAFEFRVLAETETIEKARELETAVLECLIGPDLYNKCANADGGSGTKRDRHAYVAGAAKRVSNPEFRAKLSQACKGKREVVTCPHCGVAGGGGNMRRYHFDNCRAHANQ